MMKNWKNNWQLKLIALLLAVAFWFYVYRQMQAK
jgi:YbbR domain-containing protein